MKEIAEQLKRIEKTLEKMVAKKREREQCERERGEEKRPKLRVIRGGLHG